MFRYKVEWISGATTFEEELEDDEDVNAVIRWLEALLEEPNNIRRLIFKEDNQETKYVSFRTDMMDAFVVTPLEM